MKRSARPEGALLLLASCAAAQEPINGPAATQPSPGHVLVREQVRAYFADRDPRTGERDLRELQLATSVRAGVRHDVQVVLEVPAALQWSERPGGDSVDDARLGDVRVLGAWRFHQRDSGPIDTERAALQLGAQLDTGSGRSLRPGFADDAYNPLAGVAWTKVTGRHGFDLAAEGMLHTGGGPDRLRYDAAWLFRAFPAVYAAESGGAGYAVLELNGTSETNGDHELLLSPGLMYEARRFALEAGVQLPVWQDVDKRPEIDVGVVLGLRFLF